MNFRYFILSGPSLDVYLESEKKEMDQIVARNKILIKDRDDVDHYRPGRGGHLFSITFKDGKQPPGMIRADNKLSKKEVRPHSRSKEAAPMRELFKSVRITEDCQKTIINLLNLPCQVFGSSESSRSGLAMWTSRVGHVGDLVIVEVPDELKEITHPDLKEIADWEFLKMHHESKDHDYNLVYVLSSRVA